MKKVFTFLLFLTITCLSLDAQILFQEDFESGTLPENWTIQSDAPDGGWLVGTPAGLSSQYFPISSNGSSQIIATNDDGCNCDKSDEYLIAPVLDLSGVAGAVLRFDSYFRDEFFQGNQEEASVVASLDGTSWTLLEDLHGHGGWDTHTVNLSSFAGEDTVYVAFRYQDDGGWMYGFAVDNVVVEIPPALEVALVQIDSRLFGELGESLPISGILYNAGATAITSMEISYSVNGGAPVTETQEGLNIPAFTYYTFTTGMPWTPANPGLFDVEVSIISINGSADEDGSNNSLSFAPEIFDIVVPPNKIDEFAAGEAVIVEMESAAVFLDRPTDLDFFPILGKDELWVINQRVESSGGSTVTISEATSEFPAFDSRVDGNAWHFMSLPTGIAFSDDNYNFASSPGVQDANHGGGTFTGPSLWSSDPDIYAQPSGGNGSHLDMLHGSPYSMGIAHEVDNVFWVYDDWHKDIVRYDFVDDHGPGNDDHSDAIVHRYEDIGIDADGNIPNHMVLDKATGWLYFVDNGNDRVMRLDINSGSIATILANLNEPLAQHARMGNFTTEVIIDSGLEAPCGIEIFENVLYVGDYATGDIVAYDIENGFSEITRIVTGELGLTGIKIGPDGNLWFVNRQQNTLKVASPGMSTSVVEPSLAAALKIAPNPTTGRTVIDFPLLANYQDVSLSLSNVNGQKLIQTDFVNEHQTLDLSAFPDGVYLLRLEGDAINLTKRIVLQR